MYYFQFLIFLLLSIAPIQRGFPQEADTLFKNVPIKVTANLDHRYDGGERNVFDIYLPESANPTPLVVFYHGGGFVGGDKSALTEYHIELVEKLLSKGIAVASVNYSYRKNNDFVGAKQSIFDGKYFLQYIRYNAEEYNIDKKSIACIGESAGAGISLFIALSPDLGNPAETNPLLRESTRVNCVGVLSTQATYNLFRWKRIIRGMRIVHTTKYRQFNNSIANFYGYPDYRDFKKSRRARKKELDMLDMFSPDDPPLWIANYQTEKGIPKDINQIYHHPDHAKALKVKADRNGIINYTYAPAIGLKPKDELSLYKFIIKYLDVSNKTEFTQN